ncbi:gamma-glutamyl kinase [Nioella nitratireducens]|uniref:gamma-glutamyl kinase n=1 Tax=Nioella nitratireducens TaxID=1287720 RepID=UPI0008FD7F94|nr:gamma-glutamyl kinase [Nioella nitratireducens]
MLVFWKQKIVLLAVPKTGTTALESALLPHASAAILDPPGQKHVSAAQYRNRLSKFFEQRGNRPMEVYAVMREPVEWLGSWYRYRSRPQLDGKSNSTAGMSFDDFVDAWLAPKRPDFADVGSQATFLTDDQGRLAVDRVFRYDQMSDLVDVLETRLETSLDLPRANVSPQAPVALSEAMQSRLHREAAAEFDLWTCI